MGSCFTKARDKEEKDASPPPEDQVAKDLEMGRNVLKARGMVATEADNKFMNFLMNSDSDEDAEYLTGKKRTKPSQDDMSKQTRAQKYTGEANSQKDQAEFD